MMNYTLKTSKDASEKVSTWKTLKGIAFFAHEEHKKLWSAFFAVIINASLNLVGPLLIGYAVNIYIQTKHFGGVITIGLVLLVIYLIAFIANYIQIKIMGAVGQRVLFKVRNALFMNLQSLPLSFFNQNKAGDLISRINGDTEKLNLLFSQTLVQFTSNFFIILGAGVFILIINTKLAIVSLIPALGIVIFTQIISPLVKRLNLRSLQSTGGMSGEIEESLSNFKVIIAFNRRDYFRNKFHEVNRLNFIASVKAAFLNNIFTPFFDFAGNIAQLLVLAYGIYLILQGQLSIGFLISFLVYISKFYDPLRQFASLWSTLQTALASWQRISEILNLKSNLLITQDPGPANNKKLLEFDHVSFSYNKDNIVLDAVSFILEPGKTYALVGPTGGGKTTTASLMARLYDPTRGTIYLKGRDIRSYSPEERTQKIGFILQEPFILSGTVADNILYGNLNLSGTTRSELDSIMKEKKLDALMIRFDQGLDTKLSGDGETMSLGQRQLLAFIRAVLRNPDILILDEATANIDTVTEQLLEKVLNKLPVTTTKVIIAHRLNTIANADEIFFVNGGHLSKAGSMEQALQMLMHGKRAS
jgi:ATP-binding cassette subfamily B protein